MVLRCTEFGLPNRRKIILQTLRRGIERSSGMPIRGQLQHEPFRETRQRKRLRPNPLAAWELRVGTLRVFYEEDADEAGFVNILAIGVKRGNRLLIAGEEIQL